MGADEEGTLARLKALRKTLVDPAIASHHGYLVKTTGDAMLVQFASTVDAARCAVEVQQGMKTQYGDVPEERRIQLRIGIDAGEIIFDENDIFGEHVNIAVRLRSLAEGGDVLISDVAHGQIRDKLDVGCDDLGPQALKNISPLLRAWRLRLGHRNPAPAAEPAVEVDHAPALPDKPSIAVLPFENLSNDPEQDYFADGLVEDIITALSHFKRLFVIARNSSFTYKGKTIDIKQVGRELGVRYVLEGSVRKVGSKLRIAGQLIETATGTHLWAGKFDGELQDVFELQDQFANSVAGAIDPVMLDAEIRRVADRPTDDMPAYDLYLRALPHSRAWSLESANTGIALLEQAIARDPRYGPALAALALGHAQKFMSGWSEDPASDIARGKAYAYRAVEVAPDDSASLGMAAGALTNLGEDVEVVIGLVDNALKRNPSSTFAWLWSGWARTICGQSDLAIEHFETSLRLDPRTARKAFHWTGMGLCHFFQRRLDKACALLEASFRELPSYPLTIWFLAACYAHMGRLAEAHGFAERHGIRPGGAWLKVGALYRNPEGCEYFFSGLKRATGEQA
ncbi:MAG: adenylate/guanylate cyclase domain-containing protein [Bradyrhizobium sp.]|nr:adenylate/guanylate cyclase domain-containing protein [Bradyrhizobium sp.]